MFSSLLFLPLSLRYMRHRGQPSGLVLSLEEAVTVSVSRLPFTKVVALSERPWILRGKFFETLRAWLVNPPPSICG